jgi:ribosomal protein S18 acetylase RimI-like enzyme
VKLRAYVASDWEALLELCMLAFAPACESLERLLGSDLDWKTCMRSHLRSLTRSGERRGLIVAELLGAVVGVVHYHVARETRSGSLGVSAVHPHHQGRGVGSLLYRRALDEMRKRGARYATAETGGDPSHAAARRAYERVGFVAVPTVHYVTGLASAPRPRRSTAAGRARVR